MDCKCQHAPVCFYIKLFETFPIITRMEIERKSKTVGEIMSEECPHRLPLQSPTASEGEVVTCTKCKNERATVHLCGNCFVNALEAAQ